MTTNVQSTVLTNVSPFRRGPSRREQLFEWIRRTGVVTLRACAQIAATDDLPGFCSPQTRIDHVSHDLFGHMILRTHDLPTDTAFSVGRSCVRIDHESKKPNSE